MPHFCDCGADKYICQLCAKDLCSKDYKPFWTYVGTNSQTGELREGNMCPACFEKLRETIREIRKAKNNA